jgi:hypothetical protein
VIKTTKKENKTHLGILFIESSDGSAFQIVYRRTFDIREASNAVHAIVTIGRNHEPTSGLEWETFSDQFERVGGIGSENTDIV